MRRIGAGLLLACAALGARAEQLSLFGGATDSDDHTANSYGWGLEYREPLSQWFAGSLSWINEGHIGEHRRDGAVAQVWLQSPQWHRARFSLGLGPYVYFDTTASEAARGYSDYHGIGAVLTASAELNLHGPWFMSLRANEVHAPGDTGTRALLLGLGYRFADPTGSESWRSSSPEVLYGRQQLQLFRGLQIFNDLSSREASTYGADYHLSLARHVAWSATWFYDPGSPSGAHDRVASQVWLVDPVLHDRISFGAGLGAYTQLGSQSGTNTQRLSGLFGLRTDWQMSGRWSLVGAFYRRFTTDDNDRDIVTLGVALRFGN